MRGLCLRVQQVVAVALFIRLSHVGSGGPGGWEVLFKKNLMGGRGEWNMEGLFYLYTNV